jgi:FKBP-type peptidyl-prolyl cis-trans isomerase SlyD
MGLKKGDTAVIEVPAEEAYGAKDPNLVQSLPKEYFEGIELEKGLPLQMKTPEGDIIYLRVVDFNNKTVTVDLNHPLAGRDLVFEVKIEDVREATSEEIAHGHAH